MKTWISDCTQARTFSPNGTGRGARPSEIWRYHSLRERPTMRKTSGRRSSRCCSSAARSLSSAICVARRSSSAMFAACARLSAVPMCPMGRNGTQPWPCR